MINIRFKPVCYKCKNVELKSDECKLMSYNEIAEYQANIWCGHEKVCAKFNADVSGEDKG